MMGIIFRMLIALLGRKLAYLVFKMVVQFVQSIVKFFFNDTTLPMIMIIVVMIMATVYWGG